MTHGGVIMTILSAYGIPKAGFYDWIVGNGCGYSVRITPGLWMRDKVMEVYAKVPKDLDEGAGRRSKVHTEYRAGSGGQGLRNWRDRQENLTNCSEDYS